jgi:hypothetical protein
MIKNPEKRTAVICNGDHTKNRVSNSFDLLPKTQIQASPFSLQISYFLQKCKKGKLSEISLPLLKNDITGSEPTVKMLDTLQVSLTKSS